MLYLDDVTFLYQNQPMRFDLQVRAGERVAILGPSGAGKSTLLNLIAGFCPLHSGRLWLNGQEATTLPVAQRPVSMLFQEHNLFMHLTVGQNIGLGLDPGLRLTAEQQARLAAVAESVGLADYLTRRPDTLSGGQRQRVALARCLVRDTPILLLDEPFSALDPALRSDMLALVEEACVRLNLTLLMVSHNLDDAARIAPRTLLIDNGCICYDGPTADLLNGAAPQARILGVTVKP
ncbi:thiamine ABC transporter ATP-binding protein ThiQ [Plesiomonas shigelloides]|uniref:thiamine ABC transporter ATP-binding protein ThiQ n=1 Tax=Plesiomonas shigelloides TaxID=703 RepID=UPI00126149FC|nr:thiamine ABC transporter ATP-binding protein ThiQ [Plesiomonas shigelloides]KAB7696222.1 thiamine ABC transporter ATP-binding protein ThiQ [Plesiomonas shigelloides]